MKTSLMHAYRTQPYRRTLRTRALTNNNFTFTLVIPTILQFVHIERKLRFAAFSLAFSILSGFVDLLDNIIPRYLNSYTVSISYSFIYIYALQFTNMAFVFPIFIVRELRSQKVDKRCSKAYSSYGEGASKTRSSAYANIKS